MAVDQAELGMQHTVCFFSAFFWGVVLGGMCFFFKRSTVKTGFHFQKNMQNYLDNKMVNDYGNCLIADEKHRRNISTISVHGAPGALIDGINYGTLNSKLTLN